MVTLTVSDRSANSDVVSCVFWPTIMSIYKPKLGKEAEAKLSREEPAVVATDDTDEVCSLFVSGAIPVSR